MSEQEPRRLCDIENPFKDLESFEHFCRAQSRHGAKDALESVGLGSEERQQNLIYLLDTVASWRRTKRAAWMTMVTVIVGSATLMTWEHIVAAFKRILHH